MSRLAKKPIALPKGVELQIADRVVTAKGPKGTLTHTLPPGISLTIERDSVTVSKEGEKVAGSAAMPKTILGVHWALMRNVLLGVSKGFEKRLALVGVGYRAAVQGAMLDLQLGFSHPTQISIPKQVQCTVEKGVLIIISGMDKHAVGQFAASVRAMRPPEPYKGKGIRYEEEYVRKKAGKAAAKGATKSA